MSKADGRTLFFSSPINVPLWDQARWLGVAYLHDPQRKQPPGMGLIFQNERAGRQIFSEWRASLGVSDALEDLRVAIIEGDVPDMEAGYFVHIGFEPDRVLEHAKFQGHPEPEKLLLTLVSRVHRMNPDPTSTHLAEFKADFKRHGKYELMPVFKVGGDYRPAPELLVAKTVIHFRLFANVGPNDIDQVCVAPLAGGLHDKGSATEH